LVAAGGQASEVAWPSPGRGPSPYPPDQVYQSRQDRAVFLYYRTDQRRLLCAVVKRLDGEGFLITAYPCDKIKEGDRIWLT
jgi:hypothetical protein